MDVKPLRVADGDVIEEVDQSSVTAIDAGDTTLAWTDGEKAYTILDRSVVKLDIGDQEARITDLAVGEAVVVIAEETLYKVEGAMASQRQPIDGAQSVYTGPADDYLTIIRNDGSLVWVDATSSLRQVASKSTGIDPTETVASSGYGWTAVSEGDTVHCYREPIEGKVTVATIGPELLDGTIRDLSLVDEQLVVATSDGLTSFDVGAGFEKGWTSNEQVDGLSNSAVERIYGWNDATLAINDDGSTEKIGTNDREITTTEDHSLAHAVTGGQGNIRGRSTGIELTLSVDSLSYQGHSVISLEVSNRTVQKIEERLEVNSNDFSLQSRNDGTVSVSPLSKARLDIGTISAKERIKQGRVTLDRPSSGEQLAQLTVPVEYGEVDISAQTQLAEIHPSGPKYTVTVNNEGSGIGYISLPSQTGSGGKRLDPDESTELDYGADETLLVQGADPEAERETIDIGTGRDPPTPLLEVSSSLVSDGELLEVEIENRSNATVHERLTVDTENDQRLGGSVVLQPREVSRVWLNSPSSHPPVFEVTVDGECTGTSTSQVTDHQFLSLQRRFYDQEGQQENPDQIPLGAMFREDIVVRNDSDEELTNTTIGLPDGETISDIQPGSAVTATRHVSLPSADSPIPEVEIGDDAEQIALPKIETNQRDRSVKFLSALRSTDDGITVMIEVECSDPPRTDSYRLKSLQFAGKSLLGENADIEREFDSGKTGTREIPLQLATEDVEKIENQAPHRVTGYFSSVRNGEERTTDIQRKTLAPTSNIAIPPRIQTSLTVKSRNRIRTDNHEFTISQIEATNASAIIKIFDKDGDTIKTSKQMIGRQETKITFVTDVNRVKIIVRGARRSSIRNEYTFQRYKSEWRLKESTRRTPLPTGPIFTSWEL